MKRSSKGQQVKTFKYFIPNADLTKTETQVKVYFQADTGLFSIYDGAHMFLAAQDAQSRAKNRSFTLRIGEYSISDFTMKGVVKGFEDICTAYENEMRNLAKKKVIRFAFKCNVPWSPGVDDDHPLHAKSDISFCGEPAIHLNYEVLHQVGDQVYELDEEYGTLRYRGKANEARLRDGDAVTIDWTAEREAFFENMRASLISLIRQVDDFQKNLLVNVDRAIASTGGVLLLTKSQPTGDDRAED